jgi:ADP-heptose:LPS heptosyltransferase
LLRDARLHLGPDTGSLHLAWLQGTPTVSWFLNHESLLAWAPRGSRHVVLVSALEQSRNADALHDISAACIADAVSSQLNGPKPALDERFNPTFCSADADAPAILNA